MNTDDIAEKWAAFAEAKLLESEEAKYLNTLESDDEISGVWNDLRAILKGDWGLEDLHTAELGAAWMLLYIVHQLKTGPMPISLSSDMRICINPIDETFIYYNIADVLRDELNDMDPDEQADCLQSIRNIIDTVEKEAKSKP